MTKFPHFWTWLELEMTWFVSLGVLESWTRACQFAKCPNDFLPFDTGAADIGVSHSGLAVRSVDRDIGLQVQSSQSEGNVKMRPIRSGKKSINIFSTLKCFILSLLLCFFTSHYWSASPYGTGQWSCLCDWWRTLHCCWPERECLQDLSPHRFPSD